MKRGKWIVLIGIGAVAASPLFFWEREPRPAVEFDYYLEDPSAMRLVRVMSGRVDSERRRAVKMALAAASLDYIEEPFSNQVFRGVNIVAEVGEGPQVALYFAHTDSINASPGANDNASCVAAAVDALKILSDGPMPAGLKVRFVFSDGEEEGLRGARYHANNNDLSRIIGVVGFELCGIGDAFGVWDLVGPAVGSSIARALRKAGDNLGVVNAGHGAVPRFAGDHRVFAGKGLAAVGVTILPENDEEKLRSYVEDPNNLMWLLNFVRPTIFQSYHTSADGPRNIQPAALAMTTRLMVETVRLLGLEINGKQETGS